MVQKTKLVLFIIFLLILPVNGQNIPTIHEFDFKGLNNKGNEWIKYRLCFEYSIFESTTKISVNFTTDYPLASIHADVTGFNDGTTTKQEGLLFKQDELNVWFFPRNTTAFFYEMDFFYERHPGSAYDGYNKEYPIGAHKTITESVILNRTCNWSVLDKNKLFTVGAASYPLSFGLLAIGLLLLTKKYFNV
ncbi:hypothetical protein LCGC14_0196090 [marine sediment metagenome]|uniref:Uncharacterized protein n=1 Tax=marine sediment metagenome TaxID=412755 RepID=A0A0F9X4N2_9ZZZZ